MLLVGHPRVSADLHAHLVDTRVLEQGEIGVKQPGTPQGHAHTQRGAGCVCVREKCTCHAEVTWPALTATYTSQQTLNNMGGKEIQHEEER